MNAFGLTGNGLDTDLEAFIAAMKDVDSDLGLILEKHIGLLTVANNDEDRKRARAAFNTTIKAELNSLPETAV